MSILASRRMERRKQEMDAAAERERETETTLAHLDILIRGLTEQTESLEDVRRRLEERVNGQDT